VLRSFRYRLRPTQRQQTVLLTWLHLNRELYNAALQERRDAWQKQRVSVTVFEQNHELAGVRAVRTEFSGVPIVVLRGTLRRLDTAFHAFFRRCRRGVVHPGFPRFKNARRFRSLAIDLHADRTPIVAGGKRIKVPLLGKIKFKQHRPLEGKPKAMHLTLVAGRWYVTFACDAVPMTPLPKSTRDVGIDLGLHHFVATSDGDTVDVPLAGRDARLVLERAHRRVSRRKRGSERRRNAARSLARLYGHVANIRRERHIVLARALIAVYGTVFVEKLNLRGLVSGMLSRATHDAAWGGFLHWLRVKAESAGREVVEVDPRGTSQTCPECGSVAPKPLSQREHRCACGLVCDRDVAAARVILGAGRALRGAALLVEGRRRSAKSKSACRPEHTVGTRAPV
jgi:putative transposase